MVKKTKDAYYFSHDSNARNDIKIMKLRRVLGMEGYGVYFAVIEMLREQVDYKLHIDCIKDISYELRVSEEKIKSIILSFELFEIDNEMFFSPRLLRSMSALENRRKALSEAGRRGGKAKKQISDNQKLASHPKATLKPPLSHLEALKESKVKESKVKECVIGEIEKLTPPENLPYPEMLKQNEGSGYFDRKPKIPTKSEVWEVFQRMGGTKEMAKAFWESNEGTGWFYKGSPIVNFTTLANRFIANWKEINQRNAKPKQNEPPKRKTQTAQDVLRERGLI